MVGEVHGVLLQKSCSERRRCHCITVEEGVARSVSRLLPGAPQPARDCSAIDFRQSSEFRRRAAGDITLSMPTAQAEQNITLAVLVNIASTPLGAAGIDCELLQLRAQTASCLTCSASADRAGHGDRFEPHILLPVPPTRNRATVDRTLVVQALENACCPQPLRGVVKRPRTLQQLPLNQY